MADSKVKRLIACMLVTSQLTMGLASCGMNDSVRAIDHDEDLSQTPTLEEIRKYNLPTVNLKYGNKYHQTVQEEDVLEVSRQLSTAVEEYFKSYGASDWTNEDNAQFWPKDIEYIIAAIAFRESGYRTNCINEQGCGGITGLNEDDALETLDLWLHNTSIWGEDYPNINCNANEVDIFNPVVCMEYTYYNMGYLLANRFKKGKQFVDYDGEIRGVWEVLPYSEDTQVRLIVACHLFGVGNVIDAIFERQANGDDINEYIYSQYVNDVLCKRNELKAKYGTQQFQLNHKNNTRE